MSELEIKTINYFGGYSGASLPQEEAHRWKMTQVSDDKWVLLGNWGFAVSDHEQVSELLWDFGSSSEEVDNTVCLPQGHGDDGHWDNMWRPTLSRDTADPHKRSFFNSPFVAKWWELPFCSHIHSRMHTGLGRSFIPENDRNRISLIAGDQVRLQSWVQEV